MKAIFKHPDGDFRGNVCWAAPLSKENKDLTSKCIQEVRKIGYDVSLFSEGDGISFGKKSYNKELAFDEFQSNFPHIKFILSTPEKTISMSDICEENDFIEVTYLVPVEGLMLHNKVSIGNTTFHAPIDGENVLLKHHEWGLDLCDIPGADVIPNWKPHSKGDITRYSDLLDFPLIETTLNIPAKLLYEANENTGGIENLIRYTANDADRRLDLLRWNLCSYFKLEFLPNKAGWVNDFSHVYLVSDFGIFSKGKLFSGKPDVLRVSNNWLGLEVDIDVIDSEIVDISKIIDRRFYSIFEEDIRSALRTYGQSFYLIEPEASFLSMVYAIDALCMVGNLIGFHHRVWISAVASHGKDELFSEILETYDKLYLIRNKIVHRGESFSSLRLDSRKTNDETSRILCLSIANFLEKKYLKRERFVEDNLESIEKYQEHIEKSQKNSIKFPVEKDKTFSWVKSKRNTTKD